jgi:hypothetical protein
MAQSVVMDKVSDTVSNIQRRPIKEGTLTRRIEEQTAKIPSAGFLGMAIGSMALSAVIASFARRKEFANFVGLWAPSFLLLGIYNKLVKMERGSDSSLRRGQEI